MSELPNLSEVRHLVDRLKANDVPWFRERYRNGDLAWLRDRLPSGDYDELGRRLEAGDLDWLRGRLAGIDMSAVPGASELLKGLVPLGAAGAAIGGLAGAANGAAGSAVGAATGSARRATGAVTSGAAGMAGPAGDHKNDNKRKALLGLIPLLIIAGLIILALNKCGNDDKAKSTETTVAATETTASGATETTAPGGGETTAAANAATETTSAAAPETAASAAAAPAGDILATAIGAGKFSTLAKAVDAAGLTDTLKGPGPFTVFAPNDEAFAKLPAGVLDGLLANKDALKKVLTYHVVPGALKAADLRAGDLKNVEGDNLAVTLDGTTVKLNGTTSVLAADVAASNGVIHEIDSVLLPPGFDPASLGATTTAAAAVPETTAVAAATATTNAAGDATPEGLTMYFASGSAVLDAAANAKIANALTTLKGLADGTTVNLVGHSDKNGNAAANQTLSERRATNVEAALKAGLGGKNITFNTSAKGDTEAVKDLAKSRRVTIEIQK